MEFALLNEKRKLGKGLKGLGVKSLIPQEKEFFICDIDKIVTNENQPRKSFDAEKLEELAVSIKEHGIIQPIVVKRNGDKYVIIAGERRFRASKIAGLKQIKVVLFSGKEDYQVSLIENLQRENLNSVEIAEAYGEIIKQNNFTQQELSEKIGKSRSEIANYLRLLSLSETVKQLLRENKISMGHARALTVLEVNQQIELAKMIIEKSLSVRETEKLANNFKSNHNITPKKNREKIDFSELEKELENVFNSSFKTKIKINASSKKQSLTFNFKSKKEFEDFLMFLKSKNQ